MTQIEVPQTNLGRTKAFLSYDCLAEVNSLNPNRQFEYAHKETYTPSATFHNRALFFGIGKTSAEEICAEVERNGYIGLVEIEVINSRLGVNQIRGRPVVSLEKKS